MTKILPLVGPVLGRLMGINRKHRLRSKHYAAIEDWPAGATIEVLDRAALTSRDHFPSTDGIFVVSDKLKDVLAKAAPEATFFPADAGGVRVWVVAPLSDGDVMYECEGSATYSKSGYQITSASGVVVTETPDAAWCQVRNSTLLALGDAVVTAAAAASVAWDVRDKVAEYRPYREHPYAVVSTRGEKAETLEVIGAWPAAPEKVPHPLHAWVRDAEIEADTDIDERWTARVRGDDVADAVFARMCSGLPLPALRATLDSVAKSKAKKRWKEATSAGAARGAGLFVVADAARATFGTACTYTPIELRCPVLGEAHAGFVVVQPPVVEWIDWERSDVWYRWNGEYDGFAGLHPIEASYTATQPIVRIAGTGLVLVHRELAAKLSRDFYVKPLHEVGIGLNLDDYVRAD